jgi:hypothetical protein
MRPLLHWTFIVCCAGLVALHARPAWSAFSTGVPADALAAVAIPESARTPDSIPDRLSLGPALEPGADTQDRLTLSDSF